MTLLSLKQQWPLRLIIGNEDCTFLLDNGCTFSNADPGGHEAASFQIPKDMPQTLRGQHVRLDSGLKVAFEGRVSNIQRSLGNKTAIQCEGYGALFKDANGSMIFVDRDLTRWTDPSLPRQIALIPPNAVYQVSGPQVGVDASTLLPALVQQITDSWESPNLPINEGWYDAGPENLIEAIYYSMTTQAEGSESPGWINLLFVASDANGTSTEGTTNLGVGGPVTNYWYPTNMFRFGGVQQQYVVTPAGVDGATYSTFWRNVALYGPHGLTGRGTDPVGYYPSDMFGWVVNQIPGLQPGVINLTDASGYIMPHAVYYDPVTLDQMVGDFATAAGWHWGVWESLQPLLGDPRPRADFRPRPAEGQSTCWFRRSDCSDLDITEDLSNQFNECVISFTAFDGTDQAVTITVDNQILDEAGIEQKVLELNGGTMIATDAAVFGAEALAFTNSQGRVSGSATIIAAIDGGVRAPWDMKAGIDRPRIVDLPSTDAFGSMNDLPLIRVETSLSSSGFTTSAEFGTGADLVETIQARLTAGTVLAQQG